MSSCSSRSILKSPNSILPVREALSPAVSRRGTVSEVLGISCRSKLQLLSFQFSHNPSSTAVHPSMSAAPFSFTRLCKIAP